MAPLALLLALAASGWGQQASTQPASVSVSTPAAASIILTAVGDIRLNGPVGELIAAHGPAYPSARVKDLLTGDIVFGNLECSITKRGTKTPKTWNFRAPPSALAAIKAAGFTVLNLANNHVWDFGREGFEDTLAALSRRGIPYVGGGKDLREAEKLKLYRFDGFTLGLIGFTSTFPKEAWAGRRKPGVDYSDFDRLSAVVATAKSKVDVLVVSFHGGTELAEDENDIQKAFAHVAIDAGADFVIGHHPHVVQAVELYKGKPVLYSIGNFLFVSPHAQTRYTVVVKARIGREGVQRVDFVPVDTDDGQPRPAGAEGEAFVRAALDRKGTLSQYPERFRIVPAGS